MDTRVFPIIALYWQLAVSIMIYITFIFKNIAELELLIIKHPDQGQDGGTSGISIFFSPEKQNKTVAQWCIRL